MVTVGILALQGDYVEHLQLLEELDSAGCVPVRMPNDLGKVDALVLPGGESTTLGRLMERAGLWEALVDVIRDDGIPVLGTCAGSVLLAKRVRDMGVGGTDQPTLGLMDIAVVRNAFGRQRRSFEADVDVKGLGNIRGVFIRAPVIEELWGKSEELASIDHPSLSRVIVAAGQDNMIAVTFHPEISGDVSLHRMLVEMAKR